jgi:hypothetical protein
MEVTADKDPLGTPQLIHGITAKRSSCQVLVMGKNETWVIQEF